MSEACVPNSEPLDEEEGLPYQTPAAMVLQKYVRGGYLEREALGRILGAARGREGLEGLIGQGGCRA